jgi:cbb3-type cytochrome oxidase subunit 3
MRLTDIMSNAGLSIYAEVGLVLFAIAFLVITIRIFQPSRKRSLDEASRLPLDDGKAKTPSSKEPEA